MLMCQNRIQIKHQVKKYSRLKRRLILIQKQTLLDKIIEEIKNLLEDNVLLVVLFNNCVDFRVMNKITYKTTRAIAVTAN